MKNPSTRNPLVSSKKKVMPLAAFAFFLCLASNAQDNIVNGDDRVYGNDFNTASVSTDNAGTADLVVLNPITTEIDLSDAVNGFIVVSNGFSAFDILATDGILTGSNTTALTVLGGTNLTITGGTFTGGTLQQNSNAWLRSDGALLSNVQTALVSETVFEGKTIEGDGITPPGAGSGRGKDKSIASGSHALIIENGTYANLQDVTIAGGHAGSASSQTKNSYANGGMGLRVFDSSVVLSNATITGGNAGSATAYNNYQGEAFGGDAIYASNAVIEIRSGEFTGGAAGTASRSNPLGGTGLVALGGSSITISNGTFVGIDTADVLLINSDLTTYGGNFKKGGLHSDTTGSGTNHVNLSGGKFNSLAFSNESTNGMQFLTVTNISVNQKITLDGGTLEIANLDDSAFHDVVIDAGTMIFTNDLTLNANASFVLSGSESKAFFQGLEVGADAVVDVGLGQVVTASNITVAGGASLNFLIVTNRHGSISSTGGTVSLATNTTVKVDAIRAGFSTGMDTVTVIRASSQISTNFISDIQLTENTNVTGRTTLNETINTDELTYIFATLSLNEYWDATGDLADLADELEYLASPEMNVVINNLGATASKELVETTYLTTLNTFQVAKQGLDAAVGLALSRGTEFREQLRLPKGAKGPEVENDWRFWAKYYGQFYHRNQDGLDPEYDAIMHGGVFGMDRSFGNLLLGLSGGAGRYSIDAENNAEEDMNAYQAALYTTYGKGHSYIDAGLGFGMNGVESETTEPFSLKGEFDALLASAYLGGGYGFEIPGISTVITPEAAVRYTMYQQEAYEETSSIAVPRSFDEFDADSLTGSLGLNAAMLNTTAMKNFAFKIEGRAHWIREFNPDPGDISYQLVGGENNYLIAYPYLDEDTIRLGFGFTFFNIAKRAQNNVLLRLDFDELLGEDFNSHNLSAKVIYAF